MLFFLIDMDDYFIYLLFEFLKENLFTEKNIWVLSIYQQLKNRTKVINSKRRSMKLKNHFLQAGIYRQ